MSEISQIQEFVLKKTQNVISAAKAEAILAQMQRDYPGKTFAEALKAMDSFPFGPAWMRSLVTVNETYFFRHPEQFDLLRKHFEKSLPSSNVDILCAGVSHGQEAYSIAMLLTECLPSNIPFKVTAIDLDEEAIKHAKSGRFTEMDVMRTPESYRTLLLKYLCAELTPQGSVYSISDVIREKVQFVCGNVFQFILDRYDIIFVRNILIYFEIEQRIRLLGKLRDRLKPRGLLFIGGGEMFPEPFKSEISSQSSSIIERRAA